VLFRSSLDIAERPGRHCLGGRRPEMRAHTYDLRKIFGQDARYVVPLFQRPYVWNQDRNWEPLWEDVQRAAREVEEGVVDHPHFLGAIVLAAVEPEFGQLSTWEVIDGQQRLTTLQVFLA